MSYAHMIVSEIRAALIGKSKMEKLFILREMLDKELCTTSYPTNKTIILKNYLRGLTNG